MTEPPKPIKLKKWAPKFKRGHCFAMLLFASRNSGKSYLIRHLIRDYLIPIYDIFIVVSDSPDTITDFAPCCPQGTIFLKEMNYEIFNEITRKNQELTKKGKADLNSLLIFDDKIGKDTKNDEQLLQLFTRGRHLGISIIFSSQAKKMAETTWLNNADYTIILKQNSAQQRETVVKNILKGTVEVEDPKQEDRLIRDIVKGYASDQGDALIINNAAKSSNNLFWYRAP
jgi:hypothetical protein